MKSINGSQLAMFPTDSVFQWKNRLWEWEVMLHNHNFRTLPLGSWKLWFDCIVTSLWPKLTSQTDALISFIIAKGKIRARVRLTHNNYVSHICRCLPVKTNKTKSSGQFGYSSLSCDLRIFAQLFPSRKLLTIRCLKPVLSLGSESRIFSMKRIQLLP